MCKIDQTKGKLPGSRSFGSNWGPSVMPGNWVFPPHASRPTVNLIALIYGGPRGLPAESHAQKRDQCWLREHPPVGGPLLHQGPSPKAALLQAVPAQQEQCQGGKSQGERAGPTTVLCCTHASRGLPSILVWQRWQQLCASPPLFLIPQILLQIDFGAETCSAPGWKDGVGAAPTPSSSWVLS